MIWWHIYIVYDVRSDAHVPSAITSLKALHTATYYIVELVCPIIDIIHMDWKREIYGVLSVFRHRKLFVFSITFHDVLKENGGMLKRNEAKCFSSTNSYFRRFKSASFVIVYRKGYCSNREWKKAIRYAR